MEEQERAEEEALRKVELLEEKEQEALNKKKEAAEKA